MHRTTRPTTTLAIFGLLLYGAACAGEGGPVAPTPNPGADAAPLLLSIDPTGGATDVAVDRPVTIDFDHAMMAGMEAWVDVHEGDLAGPTIGGRWTFSDDRSRWTFTPASPLHPNTVYVVHLGGGMMGAEGVPVDLEEHGEAMGGAWATDAMLHDGWSGGPAMPGPGPGGGPHGPGMGHGDGFADHMGEGWLHADGTYGMVFAFRTAG